VNSSSSSSSKSSNSNGNATANDILNISTSGRKKRLPNTVVASERQEKAAAANRPQQRAPTARVGGLPVANSHQPPLPLLHHLTDAVAVHGCMGVAAVRNA